MRLLAVALLLAAPQDEKVVWVRDYETALAQARATGKPVLCHLGTPVFAGEGEPQDVPAVG